MPIEIISLGGGGGGSGVTTITAFGSSPNSAGGTIVAPNLTLQPADATNPGGVSTGAQTFGGVKTFTSPVFATSSRFSYATASTVPYWDASKDLVSSAVTPTELGYVSGVTSAIQTQLGTKAAGAASSTDNAVARFDSTTGKVLQNSVVIVGDTGIVTGVLDLTASGSINAGQSYLTATGGFGFVNFNNTSVATTFAIGGGGGGATYINRPNTQSIQFLENNGGTAQISIISGGAMIGPQATGSNAAAANMKLGSGISTGNATPSLFVIRAAQAGAASSTPQTMADTYAFGYTGTTSAMWMGPTAATTPSSTNYSILRQEGVNLAFNVPTAEVHVFRVNGSQQLSVSSTGISATGTVTGTSHRIDATHYLTATANYTQIFTGPATSDAIHLRSTDTGVGASGNMASFDTRGFTARYGDEYFFADNTHNIGNAQALGLPKTSGALYRPKSIYVGTSVSGGEEDTNDAAAATGLIVEAQSKTAGTGNGGALTLAGGTTVGGTAGTVLLKTANTTRLTIGATGTATFAGAITPASLADAAAPNGTIYYSTDAAKLVYKDGGGVVNNLY